MSGQSETAELWREIQDLRRQLSMLSESPRVRRRLTGNLTLYVRTDGSDSNDGLANSASRAFATIQKAIDTACVTYDGSGYAGTIQVQDGTWGITNTIILHPHTFTGGIILQGNTATPSSCVIQGNTEGMWLMVSQFASAYLWTVKGFKVQRGSATNVNAIVSRLHAGLFLYNMDFGNVGSGSHMLLSEWGEIATQGAYTVSGGAGNHVAADLHSFASIGGATITFTGTPNITRWVTAQRNSGVVHRGGGSLSGLVSITSERYLAQILAYVEGIANMPGAGGTLAWGAQAL